jgi:hypothetical protein
MPHPPVLNVDRPLSARWAPLMLSGRSRSTTGPWLSPTLVAVWITWNGGVAVGPADFSTAVAENLDVHDGHAPWPSERITQRFALVDDVLWGRFAATANPEDMELVEGLRETWDDGMGALLELIAALQP